MIHTYKYINIYIYIHTYNPYKLAGGPPPFPSRTCPSHQWRLPRIFIYIKKRGDPQWSESSWRMMTWSSSVVSSHSTVGLSCPNGLVIWEVNFLGCQWTHKTISCCSSVPSILGVDNFEYPFMDFPHFRIFLRKKSLCWLHPLCLDNSGLLGGRRFSNFACWKVGAEPCNTSGCGFLISVDWFKGKSERKPWFLPAFSILVYSMHYLVGGFTTLKTNE